MIIFQSVYKPLLFLHFILTMMEQDSASAFRIPQYLYEKQNIFFIKFVHQQDEVIYHKLSSNQNSHNITNLVDEAYKMRQIVNNKTYSLNKSLTANQLLRSSAIAPIDLKSKQYSENWISISILACLLILSITRFLYFRRLGQIFKAIFVNRLLSQINRESNLKKEGITFLLLIVFFISTSLFIYKASINYFDFNWLGIQPSLSFFFLILLLIVTYYLAKLILIRFIGYVFNTQRESNDYLLYNLIFLLVIGVFLLIPVIIQSYISNTIGLYVALCFIALAEIFRLIKAIITLFSDSKFSVLFIFLYLCTVEIIPVVIAYKMLINTIKT